MDVTHVTIIQQRIDNTLVAYVQTDSFLPGQEVEVSVYLTQGENYAAHYEKQHIPIPDPPSNLRQRAVLPVELPATKLDAAQPVTVITRVAEVWPTVLLQGQGATALSRAASGSTDQGLKAIWKYADSEGKGSGDPESPPQE
jgi:hypothetical protein